MKSELKAKGLRSIVESTSDPPRQDNDEAAFENWRDKNFKTLHVIWNSYGWKEFFMIEGIY